jgi:hypothetical protein
LVPLVRDIKEISRWMTRLRCRRRKNQGRTSVWGACRVQDERFFLPSTQNFFGPVLVEQVMVDSACNSILLPLQQGKVLEILDAFRGVSGQSAVLRIKARNPSEPIIIKLAFLTYLYATVNLFAYRVNHQAVVKP